MKKVAPVPSHRNTKVAQAKRRLKECRDAVRMCRYMYELARVDESKALVELSMAKWL
jgi:hypothetical protein